MVTAANSGNMNGAKSTVGSQYGMTYKNEFRTKASLIGGLAEDARRAERIESLLAFARKANEKGKKPDRAVRAAILHAHRLDNESIRGRAFVEIARTQKELGMIQEETLQFVLNVYPEPGSLSLAKFAKGMLGLASSRARC